MTTLDITRLQGLYTFRAAVNGRRLPGPRPLVLVSHGTGGSHLGHRGLVAELARAGYLVLTPTHRGDNSHDTPGSTARS